MRRSKFFIPGGNTVAWNNTQFSKELRFYSLLVLAYAYLWQTLWITQLLLLELTIPHCILEVPLSLFCDFFPPQINYGGIYKLLTTGWGNTQKTNHFSLSIGKIKYKHSNTNAVSYQMNYVIALIRMHMWMRCLVIEMSISNLFQPFMTDITQC